jgi:drug/metabolite transporter (DMT)-like permease
MNFGKKRAAFELILAGALWGFGFIAATWAIQSFTPTETLVLRFITASVLGEALYFILRRPKVPSAKSDFLKALPAGALLGGMLLLQTIGLKYTTATKSGFLTSIYVILVPLLNTLFFKTASSWKNYALAMPGRGWENSSRS